MGELSRLSSLLGFLKDRALPSAPTTDSIADVLRAVEKRALAAAPVADSLAAVLQSRLGLPVLGALPRVTDGAADATISANTTIDKGVKIYRDLTINAGIVLTAGFSPQVVIARKITFGDTASRIVAQLMGSASSIGWYDTAAVAPDNTHKLLSGFYYVKAAGGAGVACCPGRAAGGAGSAFPEKGALLVLLYPGLFGIGGGSGANGTSGADASGGGGDGYCGGGGGGAGSSGAANTGTTGNGGRGSGILIVICDDFASAVGKIDAIGEAGTNGTTTAGDGATGGGGGAGGTVIVLSRAATVVPDMRVNGGVAGTAGNGAALSGAGGAGFGVHLRAP